jgi:hypothetical protein
MAEFLDQGAGNPEDLAAIRSYLSAGRQRSLEPEEESKTSYAAVKDRTYREHFDALQAMHSELQRHVNNYRTAIESGSKATKTRWGSSPDLIDAVLDNAYTHLGHALKAHLDKKYTRGYSDLSHYNPVNKRAYEAAAPVSDKIPGEFVPADQPHAGEPGGPTTAFDHMKLAAAALGQVSNLLSNYNAAAKVQGTTKFTNNTETYRGKGTYGRMANEYADNYGAKLSRDPEFAENYTGPKPAREVSEPGGPTEEGYSNLEERVRVGDYLTKKFTATQKAEHERRMATDADYAARVNEAEEARVNARTHMLFQASKDVRGTLITDEVARAEKESDDRFNLRKNTWDQRVASADAARDAFNDPENAARREQINGLTGQLQNHINNLQSYHTALRSLAEAVPHGKTADAPDYTSTEPRTERVTEPMPVPAEYAGQPNAAAAYKITTVQHPAGIDKPIITRDKTLNKHLNAAARSAAKLNAQLSGNRVSAVIALHAHEMAGHLTAAAQHIMTSGLGEDLTKLPVNQGALSSLVEVLKGHATGSANSLDILMHGADDEGNPKKYPGISHISAPSMRKQLGEVGDYYGRESAWERASSEDVGKRYRQLVLEAGREGSPAPKGVKFGVAPRPMPTTFTEPEIGPEPTREETRVTPKLEQFEVGRGNQPFDPRGVVPTVGTLRINSDTGEKTVVSRSTKPDVDAAMRRRFESNRTTLRNLAVPVWEKNNPAPKAPEPTGDKEVDEKRMAEYNAPLPARVTTDRGFETGASITARKEHAEKFKDTNINAWNHAKEIFSDIGDHESYLKQNNVDLMIPHGEEYLNRPMTLQEAIPNGPAGRTARMNAAFRGE